jgi:hypothetical protein
MPVLHITSKYDRETSKADHDGFYNVITSYGWARLSQSNWTIRTNEPPQAVWQKLSHCIDPNDYLVMLPLDTHSFIRRTERLLNGFCPALRLI